LLAWLFCFSDLSVFAGDLSQRFELSLDRILNGGPPYYTDRLILADVIPHHERRFTNFSGDLSGRYLGALASAARFERTSYPQLDRIAGQILRHQKPDGHFGDPLGNLAEVGTLRRWASMLFGVKDDHMAMLWGNGRLLIGLMEYYQLSRKPEVLQTARRIGDYLVSTAPIFNAYLVQRRFTAKHAVGYICWTQNIEGLVALYRATSDARYLALARQMAARTVRRANQHSHGFLSSLRGVLDLHEIDSGGPYLAQVEREWKEIFDSGNVLLPGTIPESFRPSLKRDEGCSEVDWIRLNLALWHLTGNSQYVEQAEISLFNEFAFNQFATGDFGHHGLTETGFDAVGVRAWWCCTLHGVRAFPDIFERAFHADDRTLYYDLPIDGIGKADGLSIEAESSLGRTGNVQLSVVSAGTGETELAVRVPGWAKRLEVSATNNQELASIERGYFRLRKRWKPGETLNVRYVIRTRIVRDEDRAGRVAILHGPWLLAVSEETTPGYFDEPHSGNRIVLPAAGKGGEIELPRTQHPASQEEYLAIPVARFEAQFHPGGYPSQPHTVILQPLAENTISGTAGRWEYWFNVVHPSQPTP
jgi:DUF1680 family protein